MSAAEPVPSPRQREGTGVSASGGSTRPGAPGGALLRPATYAIPAPGADGSDECDERRKTWSGAVDSRPAVIAVASTPGDVRAALDVARSHGLPFAVQSTGHGTLVPTDGGVLVETSEMAQVLVDPDRGVAHVGAGARAPTTSQTCSGRCAAPRTTRRAAHPS